MEKDAEAARSFGEAAAAAGLERLIYLGGLGQDGADLSAHLRSRRQVEHLLGSGGVPVTALRAAIIIGHGSISWEITRQLVAHLPAIFPKWDHPHAARVDVGYQVECLLETAKTGLRGRRTRCATYADMMHGSSPAASTPVAHARVPLLTPRLSSYWLSLVTDVDTAPPAISWTR